MPFFLVKNSGDLWFLPNSGSGQRIIIYGAEIFDEEDNSVAIGEGTLRLGGEREQVSNA